MASYAKFSYNKVCTVSPNKRDGLLRTCKAVPLEMSQWGMLFPTGGLMHTFPLLVSAMNKLLLRGLAANSSLWCPSQKQDHCPAISRPLWPSPSPIWSRCRSGRLGDPGLLLKHRFTVWHAQILKAQAPYCIVRAGSE